MTLKSSARPLASAVVYKKESVSILDTRKRGIVMSAEFEPKLTPESETSPKPKGKGCLPIGFSVLFFILMLGCGGYRYPIIAFLTYFVCFILVLPVPALSSFWERMKLTKNWKIGLIVLVFFLGNALASMGMDASVDVSSESNAVPSSQSAALSGSLPASADSISSSSTAEEENIPTEYKSALRKAESYSEMMSMSKQAIFDQLTSEYGEQFTVEAAQYAIDNLQADYKENALIKAQSYSEDMYMSKQAIFDQLVSEYGEQFTEEEAQYAIDNLQADYKENALQKAKSYQDDMAMSPAAIRDQLISPYGEQFTEEEADYAIANLE